MYPEEMFSHVHVCVCVQLTVLGTPAEEGGGGKLKLIDAGSFQGVDVAMMAHPLPVTVTHLSSFLCIEQYEYFFNVNTKCWSWYKVVTTL